MAFTRPGGGGIASDEVTATRDQVLAGYTALTNDSDDNPVEGTIPTKTAETYNVSTADRTINAVQYLGGNQVIKGVIVSGVDASKMLTTATVKVGDANSTTRITNVTGTIVTKTDSGNTTLNASTQTKSFAAGYYPNSHGATVTYYNGE